MNNLTFSIDQMLEESKTADMPVCRAVKDLHIKISNLKNYVSDINLLGLFHVIHSQFHCLISLAEEHYMLRKSIMSHNIPYYSDTTIYDIIDNNYEFRNLYSQDNTYYPCVLCIFYHQRTDSLFTDNQLFSFQRSHVVSHTKIVPSISIKV